jgi:pilus assembly protein CpaE
VAERHSQDTVRLLLVSTAQAVRDKLAEELSHWERDHRLYWVSQSELAPTRAEELVPDVVLIDGALPQGSALPLIDQLGTRIPSAAVLLLLDADAMDLARRGVLAGARGFVTKPIQATDLVTTLRQVLVVRQAPVVDETGPRRGPSRVIVFCSPKGGTGRTAITLNTAVSIRSTSGEPVAVVDADYAAPSVDVQLNLPTDRSIADLLPRLARLDDVSLAAALANHVSGLSVLLAPPPGEVEGLTSPQVGRILVLLKRMFPWVVVDLGLPFNDTAFSFLDGADAIVMMVMPELTGVRNVRLALDAFEQRAYPEEKVWLVLNAATARGGVPRADIEKRMGAEFRYTIPDDRILVTHSINRGVPVTMSHPRSAVGRGVQRLSRALVAELGSETAQRAAGVGQSGRKLLGRLRNRRAAESV